MSDPSRRETLRKRRGSGSQQPTHRDSVPPPSTVSGTPETDSPSSENDTVDLLQSEQKSMSHFLALCAAVIMLFLLMIQSTKLPPPRRVYAVMIDAGSTGTRAQVFKFQGNATSGHLVLNSTEMFSIKKGIAALATGAGGTGSQFFRPLLDKLNKAIPGVKRRKRTPIILRATAGLRLLGADVAENVLTEARNALNKSNFLFLDHFVDTLDEHEEGKHSWTTVNYLLGRLNLDTPEDRLVGVLEMGGGSMQLVYPDLGPESEKLDGTRLSKVSFMGQPYQLRTRSLLGLGLFEYTKKLYKLFESEDVLEEGNPCFRKGRTFPKKRLRLGVSGSEETREVSIEGDGDFERCVASAEIVLSSFEKSNDVLPRGEYIAFAYFFDRTVQMGLNEQPTRVELEELGRKLCEGSLEVDGVSDHDEACAEFSYIFAVVKALTGNFDSSNGVSIRFVQFVDGHMLGWALGATLEAVQPHVAEQIALDDEPPMLS